MEHDRKPIEILKILAVGSEFLAYMHDGLSGCMGLWSVKVLSLDLDTGSVLLELSQNWQGADTRGGQYWRERRRVQFDDLMFPVGLF